MASKEAEITQLRPRAPQGSAARNPELVRSEQSLNREACRRIAVNEADRCLPLIEGALANARWAKQLAALAQFAGDRETENSIRTALVELAEASRL
jgi:hypothetical protein